MYTHIYVYICISIYLYVYVSRFLYIYNVYVYLIYIYIYLNNIYIYLKHLLIEAHCFFDRRNSADRIHVGAQKEQPGNLNHRGTLNMSYDISINQSIRSPHKATGGQRRSHIPAPPPEAGLGGLTRGAGLGLGLGLTRVNP